jgi:signal transduction histidine kinase
MSQPHPFLSLVGNRRTVGLTAFLIAAPIGFLAAGTATREPFASSQVFLSWVAIGLISLLPMALVLLAGNRLTRRWDPERTSTRATVLAVAVLAGAARGVVIAVLPALWDLPTTTGPALRILSSALIFGMWLTIAGVALGANDRYRRQVDTLLDELVTRELAERLQDEARAGVHAQSALQRIAHTSSGVTVTLDEHVEVIDHGRTARLIREAVETKLRPLSHEMWFSPQPVLPSEQASARFLLRTLATPVPYRRALPLMTLLLFGNSLVWNGWPLGLVGASAAVVAVIAIVLPLTIWGGGNRLVANSVMYALLLLVPTPLAVLAFERYDSVEHREPAMIAMALGIPLAFFLGATAQTIIDDRKETIAALRARITDPLWDEHLGRLERRSAESAAATFLHNTVQSQLLAAAMRLERAADDDNAAGAEEALAQARRAVALASAPRTAAVRTPPRERLDELASAWQGIASIDLDLDTAMDASPANQIAVDAVEEAVANAVRHGHATAITVRMRTEADVIAVVVRDNGQATAGSGSGGVGHRWLDAATGGDWELTYSDNGTVLEFRIRA